MTIICVLALWLVLPLHPVPTIHIHTKKTEHSSSPNSRLPPRLRRSPRRRPALLLLGLPRSLRPTPQRRNSSLARCRHNHLHHPRLQRRLHIAGLRGWRAQRSGVWTDLSGTVIVYAETVSEAEVEFGEVESAISGCGGFLEWVGCCGAVFAVCVSGFWGEFELYVTFLPPAFFFSLSFSICLNFPFPLSAA